MVNVGKDIIDIIHGSHGIGKVLKSKTKSGPRHDNSGKCVKHLEKSPHPRSCRMKSCVTNTSLRIGAVRWMAMAMRL